MEGIDPHQLEQMRKIEEMKKQVLSQVLSREAFERLGRVRAVNPNLVGQVELYLLQIYQSGKLQGIKITDEQMKDMLRSLSEKREPTITRK